VVGRELDVMAHAVHQLQSQSVIAAVGSAENLRFRAESRGDALCEQWFLEFRAGLQRTITSHCVGYQLDWFRAVGVCDDAGTDVYIAKIWKLAAKTAQVTDREHRSPSEIMFKREINLMNLRVLEVGIKESHIFARPTQIAENSREYRSGQPAGIGL